MFCSFRKKKEFNFAGQLLLASPIKEDLKRKLLIPIKGILGLFKRFNLSIKTFNKINPNSSKLRGAIKNKKPFNWIKSDINSLNLFFHQPIENEITKFVIMHKPKYFNINNISSKKGFPIGFEVIPGLKTPPVVYLSLEDFTSHFSCFGLTAVGKSRLMYQLLRDINDRGLNYLIFDTKGEYAHALSNKTFQYYKIGSKKYSLFMNIFDVPDGLSSNEHIQFLYSMFLGILDGEISPQMLKVLYTGIEYVVNNGKTFIDFIELLENPSRLKIKGSYIELSATGLFNRLIPLISGPSGKCFLVNKTNINFESIPCKNVILDLSNFEVIESTIARKIFVNVFFYFYFHSIRMKVERYKKTQYQTEQISRNIRSIGNISNFVIVEEIQKIAPITFIGKNQINSFLGTAVWTARAYGVCLGFIGTDPDIEKPILTNTGIFIAFYSKTDHFQMARLLGITLDKYREKLIELAPKRRFLLSIKGEVKLLESFEYQLPNALNRFKQDNWDNFTKQSTDDSENYEKFNQRKSKWAGY
jgi:hypothetical protein